MIRQRHIFQAIGGFLYRACSIFQISVPFKAQPMNCANVIPAVPSAHTTSVSWCCIRKFPAVKPGQSIWWRWTMLNAISDLPSTKTNKTMASVEKRCNKAGTLISFRIHVFHGRDEFGKQLPPFIKTVRVPPELNARQIETLIQRGECADIKLSAADLRGKTITICSCVMYDPKNGVYEKPYPKKRKPRQLPITPQMDEILRRYLKWRGEQPEWYGDLWQESGYLFTNEYGGPMNPDNITQYLNRMGDRLQKENPNFPHLNPHAFRHAVASILVANGTDIVTTAAFIGDKPATVSERYAHIIDSAKIRAGDTLSSVIFGDGNK